MLRMSGGLQVKKKMTCEEFVRNNKGVNDGQDFPTDFLEDLFRNIERRAIRIPPAHPADNLLHHNSLPEPIRYGTSAKQGCSRCDAQARVIFDFTSMELGLFLKFGAATNMLPSQAFSVGLCIFRGATM